MCLIATSRKCGDMAVLGPSTVFAMEAHGESVKGKLILETARAVEEQVVSMLDGLSLMSVSDKPVTITIDGGDLVSSVTLVIAATLMTREEIEKLPDFGGW